MTSCEYANYFFLGRSGHASAVCYNCGTQDRGMTMESEQTLTVSPQPSVSPGTGYRGSCS